VITEVVMPQMGADMKEGTILKWRKAEGEEVRRGEIIAEIETDKANVEIEAFGSGTFRKALKGENETVPVGTVIAVIAAPEDDITKYDGTGDPSEPAAATAQAPASRPEPSPSPPDAPLPPASGQSDVKVLEAESPQQAPLPPSPTRAEVARPEPERASAPSAGGDNGRQRASPVARRLAREAGLDLANVSGTGPDGRIVRRDVEEALRSPARPPAADGQTPAVAEAPRPATTPGEDVVEDVPLSRIRQTVARRMQESKQTIPHYYLGAEVDMTEAMSLRAGLNSALASRGRITVNDLVILATARTLARHPKFNAYWVEDRVQLHSQINVGIAVALDDGLVAPAVIDCANKGLEQISREARDVAERARNGALRPDEYTAATFNVSNVGGFGTDFIQAIITPPQVGVLGVGAVKDTPVVRDGQIVIRQVMHVTLAADHRATDGADGARFLDTFRKYLESPGLMLL
jgi:pyruvate dehydrogenase E2 component (dihydrolipoamide acetyltransferase)